MISSDEKKRSETEFNRVTSELQRTEKEQLKQNEKMDGELTRQKKVSRSKGINGAQKLMNWHLIEKKNTIWK